jgi:hypothetical protein
MSDVANKFQELAAKSIEGQDPSWKNALTRRLVGNGSDTEAPKEVSEMSDSEKLDFAKGTVAGMARQFGEPMRLQLNGQVFWFDKVGDETTDKQNTDRFEGMLKNKEIGQFTGKRIDGVNDDLHYVKSGIQRIINMFNKPMKIGSIWFDSQGTKVDELNFERFENSF